MSGLGVIFCATAALSLAALLPLQAVAAGGSPSAAGAYCPLPEPGQVPECLKPAKAEFGDFFDAIEAGGVDDAQSRRLEAALSSSSQEESYMALSSIAYGYFKLAQRAAAEPAASPQLSARLDRWNQVLLEAYSESDSNPEFRQALRQAAEDLDAKAPTVAKRSGLLELIARADGRSSGMRGALEGVIGRIIHGDSQP